MNCSRNRSLLKLVGLVAVWTWAPIACEWSGSAEPEKKGEAIQFRSFASSPPSSHFDESRIVPPALPAVVTFGQRESDGSETTIPEGFEELALVHVDEELVDHIEKAQGSIESGDWATAMIELGKALYDQPNNYQVAYDLGRVALRSERIELAEKAYLLSARIDPSSADPWLQLARISLKRGDLKLTTKRAGHAQAVDEQSAGAFNLLGRVWLSRSHWDRAIVEFAKAVALSPDNRYYRNNLGFAHLMKKNAEQAVVELEKISQDADRKIPAFMLNNLGLAYELSGRLQDAMAAFAQALESNPRYTNARINLDRLVLLAKHVPAEVGEETWDDQIVPESDRL